RFDDPDRAAAATRRAFAAIWRSAATDVREPEAAARWLFTVARDAIVEGRATPATPVPQEPIGDDAWQAFRVHGAVAGLADQERVPLELAYWEGRDPVEIAELLGLSVGTVATRIRTGLGRLAAPLEGLR